MSRFGLISYVSLISLIVVLSSARADTIVSLLPEIRSTCSGLEKIVANNGTGTIQMKDYELTIDAGKDLNVLHEGILLRKIANVSAMSYYDCIKNLSETFAPLLKH